MGVTESFDCPLCNEMSLPKILRETHNFRVVPTVGPLTVGHLLIITKDHYLSMAHLDPSLCRELAYVYEETRVVLLKTYGRPIFFEHGPVSPQKKSGQSIDHAHIHAIPAPLDLAVDLRKKFPEKRITGLTELKQQVTKGVPYLFFEDVKRNRYIYDASVVPSQYLRRLVAIKLGKEDEWDWHKFPAKGEIAKTAEDLSFWNRQNVSHIIRV